MCVERGKVDLVLVNGYTTVNNVTAQFREHVTRQLALILPEDFAGRAICCDNAVERRRDVDSSIDGNSLAVLTF